MCRPFCCLWFLAVCLAICLPAWGEETPMTECAAIRALSRETAAAGHAVHVKGMVTFAYHRKGSGLVLQNGGVGIYVDRQYSLSHGLAPNDAPWLESLTRGTEVEVIGITGPGHFAPVIYPKEIRVLGTAAMPEPVRVSFAELLDGRWDCQLVRLSGTVQYAGWQKSQSERVRLELAANGGRITVNVLQEMADLSRLVDADLEADGVAFTYFNNRGELLGTRVLATDASDVRVIKEGPEDPFAAPVLPLTALRPFAPEGLTFHRRRCTGVVTLARPGHFFYIQEGQRGVRVETRDPVTLSPGDRVEVSGFIEVADHFGKVREASVRKIGEGARPAPVSIDRRRVLGTNQPGSVTDAEDLNGRFATLRGRLEKIDLTDAEGPRLLIETEGKLVSAVLARDTPPAAFARLDPGSEMSINGVIRVELASGWPAQDFPHPVDYQFFVHSPEDLVIVSAAPWWTAQRLWLLVSGICTVLAATLGWNWLLRRRVEQRGAQLADEMRARREAAVEFDATLRERERLAADLHDTLEQSLTGVAFRLETMVVKREKAQDYSEELDHVRQLFASTREDVRRSIWNLRSNALEGRTLPEAIHATVNRLIAGRDVLISVKTDGAVRTLPDFTAGNLLLLAVEAVTNALKHADPKSIAIDVRFAERTVALAVEDDGRGFDVHAAAGPLEGHFGIQGMRERAKRMGGALEVSSQPGGGARFAVTVPVR